MRLRWPLFSSSLIRESLVCWRGPLRGFQQYYDIAVLWHCASEDKPYVYLITPPLRPREDGSFEQIPHLLYYSEHPELSGLCLFDPNGREWSNRQLIADTTHRGRRSGCSTMNSGTSTACGEEAVLVQRMSPKRGPRPFTERRLNSLQARREQLAWPADRPFRILSLDGGGIRGVYAATLLALVETELLNGAAIADHVDMIAGTSTGGIIAIGLGLGKPATQIERLYVQDGQHVFPGVLDTTSVPTFFSAACYLSSQSARP